jgi:7-cyano-7-deazaguanine reductase
MPKKSKKPDAPVRDEAGLPHATLGKRRSAEYTYNPKLLEAIPFGVGRKFAVDHTWVSNNCLRFTALCPVTGSPDWADLYLNYIPDAHLVESKSLKEYLQSFRMHGDFHEDVCRTVCDDLVACMKPRYIEVIGHFDSRGSIAIWPYVQYAKPGDAGARMLLEHRRLNYVPGAYAPQQYQRSI